MGTSIDSIDILHVAADPAVAETACDLLEREDTRFTIETARSVEAVLNRLGDTDVDCIVSDHDVPAHSGIELLTSVREEYPDLPVILFTENGSEALASEAISAGVTDYVEKEGGTDQYAVLATRITEAVEERYSQTAYREIFENVPDGIVIQDPADGEFIDMNEQYAELFGYDREEFLAAGFEVIHQSDPPYTVEDARDHIRAAIDHGSHTFEWPGIRKTGERFWADVHLAPIRLHGTDRLLGSVRDVTERKQRERQLEILFDNAPFAIAYTEFENGEPIVRDVNPVFEQTFGYDAESAIGESLDELVVPADRYSEAREINEDVLAGNQPELVVQRETTAGLRDFMLSSIPLEPGETIQRSYAVYRDVTERKNREDAVRQLHAATRDLMEASSGEAAATLGSETASDVLELPMNAIYRYDADADRLVPVAWSEDIEAVSDGPPASIPVADSLAGTAYRTGESTIYADVAEQATFRTEQTEIRTELHIPIGEYGLFVAGSPSPDDFDATDQALARILATNLESALQRVDREQELQRQNERLEQFANVVSHDLQNPLNVAQGWLDLAREECESEYLEKVSIAHDRMETLIADILTLAREGEHVDATEPVALRQTIDRCWETVQTMDATLAVDTEQTIQADPNRLKQLLENLFTNAVEHGGDDVVVTVGSLDEGTGFYVADTGPGIPPAERDTVFEARYSTTEDGTGFGLNIVREIAEAHDWEVSVTESAAGGARFEIAGVDVSGA